MFAINPPADSVIEQYLCQKLSLSSPDQVVRTPCNANGYQSAQSSYQVITDEGEKMGIFIKTVNKEANELSKIMDKEILMYETIIPEVTKFVESNDKDLADQVRACFPKYYGNSRGIPGISRDDESLFLEDLSCRGNIKLRDGSEGAPDPVTGAKFVMAVVKKLSLINASFYVWQTRCNPGFSTDEMKEKYPALKNYPLVLNSKDLGEIAAGVPLEKATGILMQFTTSIASKVVITHIEDIVLDNDEKATYISTMGRMAALAKYLPELVAEVRNQNSQLTSPILGDLNPNNIAISTDDTGDMIFYDFGLAGFSSPLMDVHWFLGLANLLGVQGEKVQEALDEYIDNFIAVSEKLGTKIERDALLEEFNTTKLGQYIVTFIVAAISLFFQLKMSGASEESVKAFVHKISKLDGEKDKDEIREEVAKLLNNEQLTGMMILLVKVLKNMEDCIDDLERLVPATE